MLTNVNVGLYGKCILFYIKLPNNCPEWLYHFALPPEMYE